MRRLECVRRLREAQQCNESVRRDARYCTRRDKRGKGDRTREDGAQQSRGDDEYDRDRILRPSIRSDAPNPT